MSTKAWARSYEWDDSGLLEQVVQPGLAQTFTRDAFGRAVGTATTTPDGVFTSTWAFDGLDPVVQTLASGQSTTLVTDPAGELSLASTSGGSHSWVVNDYLGSAIATLGTTGQVDQTSAYSTWGSASYTTPGWSLPVGFSGETTTASTGLVGYHARNYDPAAGTWTARDPWRGSLDLHPSLSRYGYVLSNPASLIDHYGYLFGFLKKAAQAVSNAVKTAANFVYENRVAIVSAVGMTRRMRPSFWAVGYVADAVVDGRLPWRYNVTVYTAVRQSATRINTCRTI